MLHQPHWHWLNSSSMRHFIGSTHTTSTSPVRSRGNCNNRKRGATMGSLNQPYRNYLLVYNARKNSNRITRSSPSEAPSSVCADQLSTQTPKCSNSDFTANNPKAPEMRSIRRKPVFLNETIEIISNMSDTRTTVTLRNWSI